MTNLTFKDLLSDYKDVLEDGMYYNVLAFYISGNTDDQKLWFILFDEETDWMYDSSWDKSDRAKGISPMNHAYTERKNKKRIALGVSPLDASGLGPDNTSFEFCKAIIKNSPKYSEDMGL